MRGRLTRLVKPMSVHPRNSSTNRYLLFEEIFGKSKDSTVLDFGGNSGNLLYFSNNNIRESNYTNIDVSKIGINYGVKEFPNSKFYYYDRYNWMYNHNGNEKYNFPTLNSNHYDFVWAYSVFSHTDFDELLETIKWFCTFKFKKIAVSILDIANYDMIEYFYNKRVDDYGSCISISEHTQNNILYFFDNNKTTTNSLKLKKHNCKHFLTFYNIKWLKDKFLQNNIYIDILYPGNKLVPFIVIDSDKYFAYKGIL